MLILDRFVSSADLVTFMYFSGSSSITKSSLSFSLLSMKMTKVKVPQMDMTTCSRELDKLLHIFQSILTMSLFLKAQGHFFLPTHCSAHCTLQFAIAVLSSRFCSRCLPAAVVVLENPSLVPDACLSNSYPKKADQNPIPFPCLILSISLFLTHHSPSSERRSSSLQL